MRASSALSIGGAAIVGSSSLALRTGLIRVQSGQESRIAPDRELEKRVCSYVAGEHPRTGFVPTTRAVHDKQTESARALLNSTLGHRMSRWLAIFHRHHVDLPRLLLLQDFLLPDEFLSPLSRTRLPDQQPPQHLMTAPKERWR